MKIIDFANFHIDLENPTPDEEVLNALTNLMGILYTILGRHDDMPIKWHLYTNVFKLAR